MDFKQALVTEYRQAPCQVLPNALWKTVADIPSTHSHVEVKDGQISELRLWDADRLLVYWKPKAEQMDFSGINLDGLKLALVHQRALPNFPAGGFSQQTAYFRYWHDLKEVQAPELPPGFILKTAQPDSEAAEIAALISHCYPDILINDQQVLSWRSHPVYDPALWLWLVDEADSQPVALGIAEYDNTIKEGSLEWVQVLPEYRRRGLGKTLVLALLQHLSREAEFVTVSGQVNSPSDPAALYRQCGFSGEDVWWVFRQ
jgi:GNAT superfamily N-acetyltransferase